MNTRVEKMLAMVIVFFAATLVIDLARAAGDNPSIAGGSEDEAAIKQVVAGFSNGWNTHDAHAMCSSLADDVQWLDRGSLGTTVDVDVTRLVTVQVVDAAGIVRYSASFAGWLPAWSSH